jgi:Predicted ornithine cyclodeaminase, mu-crystallin homolog
MLWLSKEDVISSGVSSMSIAQAEVEETFRLYAEGKVKMAQEIPLRWKPVFTDEAFYSLPAYVGGKYSVAGIKWTTHHPDNKAKGLPHIYTLLTLSDPDTGIPLTIMEGSAISAYRTGAVTATALKYLADPGVRVLLCCGAGVQARQQILAAHNALPGLEKIRIWSRTKVHAEKLALELCPVVGGTYIEAVDDISSARESDIIIAATSSAIPYLCRDDFKDGVLYCHIGFNDIETDAIAQFDQYVYDDFDSGKSHSGQPLFRMVRDGIFDLSKNAGVLSEIITGAKKVRQCKGKKLMFDAFGLVIFDIALGHFVYKYALEHGIGQELALWKQQ